jgi:hypothetical protein
METTNSWDPAEQSTAQQTAEATEADVFKFRRDAPASLKYTVARDRRKIHEYVYKGCWWVDLVAIEGEAVELLARDPGQAARFFGNRLVRGKGAWLPDGLWEGARRDRAVTAA